MSLNKRKNKRLIFWALFRRTHLVGPCSLGFTCKKKMWKRFLFSSVFWKKKAFFMVPLKYKSSLNSSPICASLSSYVLFHPITSKFV